MTCIYYDKEFKNSTCTYSVGDALCTCPCDGVVKECSYVECGTSIAEEG